LEEDPAEGGGAFLAAGGTVMVKDLQEGESIVVETSR
jgi:hypothetical protein